MTRTEILARYKIDKNLSNADLRNANLSDANLSNADLRNANLSDANLSNANLSNANLWNANLWNANLRNANLSDANLSNANLRNAKNIPSIFHYSLNILKFQKGKLRAFKYLNGNKSPYQNYEYIIGKTYIFNDYNRDERVLCGEGGNVATLEWCLRETGSDLSKTYIIVEFMAKDIIAIPYNSDGKFRVKKLKVIRKVKKSELEKAIKPLYIS